VNFWRKLGKSKINPAQNSKKVPKLNIGTWQYTNRLQFLKNNAKSKHINTYGLKQTSNKIPEIKNIALRFVDNSPNKARAINPKPRIKKGSFKIPADQKSRFGNANIPQKNKLDFN
jgi:hypothetical protein